MHPNLPTTLFLSTLFALSACSSQQTVQQPEEVQACVDKLPNSKLIKKQAVTTGCIASALFWKAIGQENPVSLVCFAGGGAGYLFGKSVAERKCSYRVANERIEGEIAHTKKMNANFIILMKQKATSLAEQQEKVESLLAQQKAGQVDIAKTDAIKKEVTTTANNERDLVSMLSKEVAFKRKTLEESEQLDNKENIDSLHKEIRLLYKNIKKLREANKELYRLENQLSGL